MMGEMRQARRLRGAACAGTSAGRAPTSLCVCNRGCSKRRVRSRLLNSSIISSVVSRGRGWGWQWESSVPAEGVDSADGARPGCLMYLQYHTRYVLLLFVVHLQLKYVAIFNAFLPHCCSSKTHESPATMFPTHVCFALLGFRTLCSTHSDFEC